MHGPSILQLDFGSAVDPFSALEGNLSNSIFIFEGTDRWN
jgi:hypothetical protein